MKKVVYDYCGAQNNHKNRYLFVLRGEEEISLRHIHCYESNNIDFYFVTQFRDLFNKHKEYAKEYNDLKIFLAKQYPNDRFTYTDRKENFIRMIYQKIDTDKYKGDTIE